jgi:hypothetical protein
VKNKLRGARYRRDLALFSRHHHYTPNGSARRDRARVPVNTFIFDRNRG